MMERPALFMTPFQPTPVKLQGNKYQVAQNAALIEILRWRSVRMTYSACRAARSQGSQVACQATMDLLLSTSLAELGGLAHQLSPHLPHVPAPMFTLGASPLGHIVQKTQKGTNKGLGSHKLVSTAKLHVRPR